MREYGSFWSKRYQKLAQTFSFTSFWRPRTTHALWWKQNAWMPNLVSAYSIATLLVSAYIIATLLPMFGLRPRDHASFCVLELLICGVNSMEIDWHMRHKLSKIRFWDWETTKQIFLLKTHTHCFLRKSMWESEMAVESWLCIWNRSHYFERDVG